MSNESVLNILPENTNFLQTNKYTMVFPTLPFLRYFSQTATIPAVSTAGIPVPTPFTDIYRHGTQMKFEDFTINAIVDEDLRVWEETFHWIQSLTRPQNYRQYIRNVAGNGVVYHDAILTVNTNSNNPNLRFKFFNCHPTNIGAIAFNTTDTADTIPTVDITFRYDYYELDRVSA
jgi:hypothetical protein